MSKKSLAKTVCNFCERPASKEVITDIEVLSELLTGKSLLRVTPYSLTLKRVWTWLLVKVLFTVIN